MSDYTFAQDQDGALSKNIEGGGITMKEWLEKYIAIKAIEGVPQADTDRDNGITAQMFGVDIPAIYKEYTQ